MKFDGTLQAMGEAVHAGAVVVGALAVLMIGCSAEEASTPDNDRTTGGTQMMEPEQVAEAYFSRMRAADLDVVNLFHEDAVLLGLGMRVSGHEAIREFYTKAIETGGPQPRLAGPLMTDGRRVVAELHIDLSTGASVHAVDIFHVEDGRIRLLNYFLSDEPAEQE
ncbi:MAG: nuclear transport factor 2 family protein [Deltaproteobacteria bacterium]|nr:nuclear transport factor 2 family protein [Deltaproteobacteria bacterium]MBW2396732.1 nuclear transport factor 2 family protein [Deltaproteobacteria bacterium]